MAEHTYDVVVIGAGPAGENAADYATQRGLSVAVVERELVGGECSYWACMPSKALLRPTEVVAMARRQPAAAPAVTGTVTVADVLANRDSFASLDDSGQAEWLEGAGIALHRGTGRLAGEGTVEVAAQDGATTTLHATAGVVLATGSRAATVPLDGIDAIATWDNRDVTQMDRVPARTLVLGGGVVGCEMGQALARLGSRVTIVQRGDQVLSNEEPAAAARVAEGLERDGVTVVLGASAVSVARDGADGEVTLGLEDGTELVGDELLVAVGREGISDDVGLDTVGVVPGRRGTVEVDEHLRVLVDGAPSDWLSAVGDVNGRALLTHQGKYQARLVGDRLAGVATDPAWADDAAVPRVVFTDPQLAAVGHTEQSARDAGVDVRVLAFDTGSVAGGALLGKDAGGPARLVVDQERRVVVGATFVGAEVAELVHSATIAIVGQVPVDRLWHAVPSFPTVSEVWLRLLEQDRSMDL